jgi:hypothetical protein
MWPYFNMSEAKQGRSTSGTTQQNRWLDVALHGMLVQHLMVA